MIVELGAVRPDDRARVGGKATGCASLMRLGLPVPPSVVITTEAFDRFFATLEARRREFCRAIQESADESALHVRAEALKAEVRRAALPAEVARALEDAASRLTAPLAVRSSATAEDSPATAFAGVFHSELNVARERLAEARARLLGIRVRLGRDHARAPQQRRSGAGAHRPALAGDGAGGARGRAVYARSLGRASECGGRVVVDGHRPRRSCKARRAASRRECRATNPLPPIRCCAGCTARSLRSKSGSATHRTWNGRSGATRWCSCRHAPSPPSNGRARRRSCGRASSRKSASRGRSRRSAGRCSRAC